MSIIQGALKIFMSCIFNVKIEGLENIPKDTGVIIAPNHISNWDPPLIGSILYKAPKTMAKAELFKNPILAKLFTKIGAFPIKRGEVDLGAIRTAISVLKSNDLLLLFPHGTRLKKGEDAPIKEGIIMIALRANADIIPTYISGSYGFRKRVTVRFGKPFDMKQFKGTRVTAEEQKQLADKLWSEMKQLEVK